jgi:UDP-N-acetylmuramate dehydrogenase
MLGSISGDVRFKEPLSVHTSLRLGGPVDIFITPESVDDIRHAVRFADREQLPVAVVGAGTHVLAGEQGFRGVVLKLDGVLRRVEFHGEEAVAGAGAEVFALARAAAALGLGGLADLVGTVGTVGGALAMQDVGSGPGAGRLVSALCFVRPDGSLDELKAGLHGLGDHALEARGHVFVGCRFKLERRPVAALNRELAEALRARPLLQTLTLPAATAWRDPPGLIAGALLEQAGLAGKRVKAAEICARHPGVIVNRGGATAADVLALIQLAREQTLDRTGVRLEPAMRSL